MSSNGKGELHRIYWQQWVTSSEKKSRRELITSSAGIRISHSGARAKDVTHLLRKTLKLSNESSITESGSQQQICDNLVLIGTLYSLPRDYVQFEHEEEQRLFHQSSETQESTNSIENGETASMVSSLYPKSEPYHIVKTLHPDDDPLEMKRRMEDRLKVLQKEAPVTRTIISPKLQWFFIPSSNEKDSLIPNCVELDGYCSSLENENSKDDSSSFDDEEQSCSMEDDNSIGSENDTENDDFSAQSLKSCSISQIDVKIQRQFPWLQTSEYVGNHNQSGIKDETKFDPTILCKVNKERQRRRLFHKQQNAVVKTQSFAGYLTKQSKKDPNVWRKCYCVLADNHMWYISRIYGESKGSRTIRYSKHGRIRLTNALLLEPSPDYTPLYRTPFAFELITGNGKSHVFRAMGKSLQLKWIQTLSSRIIESYENSFLDSAELIVADETLARTRRMEILATEPFWKVIVESQNLTSLDTNVTKMHGHLGAVLRWGMQVASFKERCRYIQSSLPAKNLIVIAGSPQNHSSWSSSSSAAASSLLTPNPMDSVDPILIAMIESTWTRATELLARATHVATKLQPRLSHSIEAQCRHIDYVIHGRFRTSALEEDLSRSSLGDRVQQQSSSENNNDRNSHRDLPPIDLFDHLLQDLQALAAKVAIVTNEKTATTATS